MPACCTNAVALDVMNSAALYICRTMCSLVWTHPSRQPVMLYVLEKLLTTTRRRLSGTMRANDGAMEPSAAQPKRYRPRLGASHEHRVIEDRVCRFDDDGVVAGTDEGASGGEDAHRRAHRAHDLRGLVRHAVELVHLARDGLAQLGIAGG